MALDYRVYLATQILSEQRTISYRTVSRALNVHVNSAKRMLYDFHAHENGKKPGSIHATYLLAGTKKKEKSSSLTNGHANGNGVDNVGDDPMPSSPPPFPSSMLQSSQQQDGTDDNKTERLRISVTSITLVREESLEALKEQYETITSIHIYSLSPQRLQDLQTLTDIGRDLYTSTSSKEDPLTSNKTYGVIQNPGVRRRTDRKPPISDTPAPKFQPVKNELKKSTTPSVPAPSKPSTKKDEHSSRPGSAGSTTVSVSAKQPSLKRDTSDIFKSFAKTKAKSAPKLERKDSSTSANADSAVQSGAEDVKMADSNTQDDGESEEEALFLDTGTRKAATKKRPSDGVKTEREDRAAKLRKMMEDGSDEDDEVGKPDTATNPANKDMSHEDKGEGVAWSDSETETATSKPATKKIEAKDEAGGRVPPPGNGAEQSQLQQQQKQQPSKRRRARRKVMKKRTMKDEEGYLVTREEAVWESFSEDEPNTPAPSSLFRKQQQQQKSSNNKHPPNSSGTNSGSQPKSSAAGSTTTTKAGSFTAGKGTKGGGGGNIMSFFAKK